LFEHGEGSRPIRPCAYTTSNEAGENPRCVNVTGLGRSGERSSGAPYITRYEPAFELPQSFDKETDRVARQLRSAEQAHGFAVTTLLGRPPCRPLQAHFHANSCHSRFAAP
jgi:hypothetical protein